MSQDNKEQEHGSWIEWSKHVLNELERLNAANSNTNERARNLENAQSQLSGLFANGLRCQEHGKKLDQTNDKLTKLTSEVKSRTAQCDENRISIEKENDKISELKADIATLKVKSGTWGAAGAAIPIVIGLIIWLVSEIYNHHA